MVDDCFTSDPVSITEKSGEDSSALAEYLAKLLQQTAEYQELLRLGHLINLDPDVSRLLLQIRRLERAYGEEGNGDSMETLHTQLEALPAYQTYARAENAARELFCSVNQVISAEAGLDFAAHARHQGCGCGG
jgi:hypothetical protein